jgi:hypothetical protein
MPYSMRKVEPNGLRPKERWPHRANRGGSGRSDPGIGAGMGKGAGAGYAGV